MAINIETVNASSDDIEAKDLSWWRWTIWRVIVDQIASKISTEKMKQAPSLWLISVVLDGGPPALRQTGEDLFYF